MNKVTVRSKFLTFQMKTYHFLGLLYGCHRMPSRSFFYKGRQFPICARCTGMLIGNILAIPVGIMYRSNVGILFLMLIPMIIDGTIQAKTNYESTNFRRLITGFLAGLASILLYIESIVFVYHLGMRFK